MFDMEASAIAGEMLLSGMYGLRPQRAEPTACYYGKSSTVPKYTIPVLSGFSEVLLWFAHPDEDGTVKMRKKQIVMMTSDCFYFSSKIQTF